MQSNDTTGPAGHLQVKRAVIHHPIRQNNKQTSYVLESIET